MKILKVLAVTLLISCIGLTSCQKEIDIEHGNNPNTNSFDSETADNLKRSSMYDGTIDDFIDDISCSSVLFPYTVTVNGIDVTLLDELDYVLVTDILNLVLGDDDSIVFHFPITVKQSDYTEITITNQTEYDALINACEQAENNGENAITCFDINFPVTIFIYDLDFEQTGSVVIESEQELFNYMNTFSNNELFSVYYPISITLTDDTTVELTSDADLEAQVSNCIVIEEAEDDADLLKNLLINGLYKIDSLISVLGTDIASDYTGYTLDFADDLSCTAEKTAGQTINIVNGTYVVTSDQDVFLTLSFTGNIAFNLLNNTWEVTSFSQDTVTLQHTTISGISMVLKKI